MTQERRLRARPPGRLPVLGNMYGATRTGQSMHVVLHVVSPRVRQKMEISIVQY
jgi:hypothetical protein